MALVQRVSWATRQSYRAFDSSIAAPQITSQLMSSALHIRHERCVAQKRKYMAYPKVLSIRKLEQMGVRTMIGNVYVDVHLDGAKYVKVFRRPVYALVEPANDFNLLAK